MALPPLGRVGFDFDCDFPREQGACRVRHSPCLVLMGVAVVKLDLWRIAMGVLGWIVFGLVVGIVAKLIVPGRDPGGLFLTMVLGGVGALIGAYLGRILGLYGPNDSVGFFMAVGRPLPLLVLYRFVGGGP